MKPTPDAPEPRPMAGLIRAEGGFRNAVRSTLGLCGSHPNAIMRSARRA
jgi:hypothetical protein